jgi:cob(I)alamin adenosyltransferase
LGKLHKKYLKSLKLIDELLSLVSGLLEGKDPGDKIAEKMEAISRALTSVGEEIAKKGKEGA